MSMTLKIIDSLVFIITTSCIKIITYVYKINNKFVTYAHFDVQIFKLLETFLFYNIILIVHLLSKFHHRKSPAV